VSATDIRRPPTQAAEDSGPDALATDTAWPEYREALSYLDPEFEWKTVFLGRRAVAIWTPRGSGTTISSDRRTIGSPSKKRPISAVTTSMRSSA